MPIYQTHVSNFHHFIWTKATFQHLEYVILITSFTHGEGDDAEEMLGVDYARLTCVLWTCVKSLTARIEALEAPKKKTSKSKTT